ncbi:hypothetical protein KDM41_12325 [bacterium]|nr:hypothetical protein [bacterium]
MAGAGKKWLLGCGLGCGIPVLVVTVVTIVGGARMMKPFDGAIADQKELTAAYGARDAWTPPVDGLTPDRLESFLAVRRALQPQCADFAELASKFKRIEDLEEDGKEPTKGDVFKAVGGLTSAVFGIAGKIGSFTAARNEALLANGMGLGEYIWIYTLAYNSDQGHPPNQDFDTGDGGRDFSAKEQRVIRSLMANHADALAAAGRAEEAALWRAEIDRLERAETNGVPFPDGALPAEITDQLAPRRDELAALYCAESSAFEFGRVHKRGLSVSSE